MIGNEFQERVSRWVFVVINVRFDLDESIGGWIIFVKCELHVGFTKLHLLVTPGSAGMHRAWKGFRCEVARVSGSYNLIDQVLGSIGKETILTRRFRTERVPDKFFAITKSGGAAISR
jgi:hypothetical protein